MTDSAKSNRDIEDIAIQLVARRRSSFAVGAVRVRASQGAGAQAYRVV
jgi:hypothetical protein